MAQGFGKLVLTPKQKREAKILGKSVLQNFQHLEDPRTGHREKKLKALHSVSAWSSEHNLVLAQQKVESKSNEIKAIPLLLNLLNLKGAVVTVDAMGTQIEIVKQIKQLGGEYVCGLKGNQGLLHQQVKQWFEESETKGWQGIDHSYHETIEAGHHRIETRRVWTVPVKELPLLHRQNKWVGLTTVVMVYRKGQLWNKTTEDVRFYLSSLKGDAQEHNGVIRSHWTIENSLHWVLDVTFNEDASRVRTGHAAENLALIRRLSISLLKGEPSRQSLKQKRYRAGLDNNFLLKILEENIVA